MQQTISILVSGKVQGVFFRQGTKELAGLEGITGEVSNTPDGKVFIQATGTPAQLGKLLEWCRQGPPKAIVTSVEQKEIPLQSFTGFRIVRS